MRIAEVVKHFGSVIALDGVSLEMRPRECFGLLGPNGAGKSTLIRSIVGRVRPDSGQILILGVAAESAAARAALGWVPQELAVYPRLTCRENLASFGRYHGLSGLRLQEAITWCLDWAALADRAEEPVNRLSGGMKRRLNMAGGLIHRPRIVLMDEPTVGVDPQSRLRIFEMIEALRREGMSVIYTTHYMEEAERLCDRIAIIDHGRIIAQGSKDELIRNAFGSRSQVVVRLADTGDRVLPWIEGHGGRSVDGTAQFTVEQPGEIAALLQAAANEGHEVLDVSLHRPNLESVFLHLTGRELRE
ncbi:MAG TPA: ABC transporter ATP-binding protein [Terriglobales bacterium]|nr:ABC transporter ATP-binding protein [Terriglobales bacterium]